MTTICTLLKDSQLPDSPSARLDTELLLAAAMGKPRSFLRTWPERIVPREANERFDDWIARRRNGEPVATSWPPGLLEPGPGGRATHTDPAP